MSSPLNTILFGDQTAGDSPKVAALRKIDSSKYNRSFQENLAGLNGATDYMAQYMRVMQKGIDDANKNIIQKIQDFIADLIIIFTGGSTGDSGFDWGDLKYIIAAIGQLFGFGPGGPIDLLGAALHFLQNFLKPLGAFGDAINDFIAGALHILADLLDMVPIVGNTLSEIIDNIADGINGTNQTANTANSTATTALGTANTANSTANAASSTATAAQTAASNAANIAAAAQDAAEQAVINAQYWKDEFSVSASAVVYGANDETLGMFMDVPTGKVRKITAVNYRLTANSGTMTIDLVKRDITGADTVIWTTNIPSAATSYRDNGPDIVVNDRDYVRAEVTNIGGTATALHCALIGTLTDA